MGSFVSLFNKDLGKLIFKPKLFLNNISEIAISKPPSEISCAAVTSFLSFNFNNISITFFSCFRLTGGGAASITFFVTS